MAKRVTPEDIKQFHRLYHEVRSYAEVAKRTGFSASTVSRYVNPNQKNAPRMALEAYKELLIHGFPNWAGHMKSTSARPIEEVAATLLHEMVHYFNYENGVQDCSRGNTYHNKKFKAAAEAHGLNVTHSGTGTTPPPARTSSTRKYICPCCGNSVRATKAVNIGCLDCGVQMVLEK